MSYRTVLNWRWWPLVVVAAAVGVGVIWFLDQRDRRPPDVLFVTTPHDIVAEMLNLAEVKPTDTVYDLGSGDGRVLMAAARRGANAVGYDIDPALVESSRDAIRAAGLDANVRVHHGDIFRQDLTPATVVTMFLTPGLNERLRPQLDALRPGTRVVSHMWRMPGAVPANVIEVKSAETGLEHRIYLWVTPIDWTGDPRPTAYPPASKR